MYTSIKKIILKNKAVAFLALSVRKYVLNAKLYHSTKVKLINSEHANNAIYYLGIPAHANLGDLAQGMCIRHWLKKNYPNSLVVEIETNALVNTHFPLLNKLKKSYQTGDMVIFQSGYTTTDLGGYADEMHRAVIDALPEAKFLMMPQTIYFKSKKNQDRTSKCYNKAKNMLFLARDRVSYGMACEMFPNITIMQYPDIVTSLIGSYHYDYPREGILLCCRNDGEQFYTCDELNSLKSKLSKVIKTEITDTTKNVKFKEINKNISGYVEKEINSYAHYNLIITDRYHGSIFSLAANTPVIVIRTTDHKVTTGVEWFKGVYDDYIFLADSLDDAYNVAQKILNTTFDYNLKPYFKEKYYDKLPELIADL